MLVSSVAPVPPAIRLPHRRGDLKSGWIGARTKVHSRLSSAFRHRFSRGLRRPRGGEVRLTGIGITRRDRTVLRQPLSARCHLVFRQRNLRLRALDIGAGTIRRQHERATINREQQVALGGRSARP